MSRSLNLAVTSLHKIFHRLKKSFLVEVFLLLCSGSLCPAFKTVFPVDTNRCTATVAFPLVNL